MPRYEDAIARILYLLGEGPYRGTPNTITADSEPKYGMRPITVYSYRKPILRIDNKDHALPERLTAWTAATRTEGLRNNGDPNNGSVTTNRHITAACDALRELGYEMVRATRGGVDWRKVKDNERGRSAADVNRMAAWPTETVNAVMGHMF